MLTVVTSYYLSEINKQDVVVVIISVILKKSRRREYNQKMKS